MATDVNVQYFSHLNGLNLGNNWGDMIRLLDTCLVNGLGFSSITAASIDSNGDINLTFFADHKALLFQIVELTGFTPANINGLYRIKGVPSSKQLILKAQLTGQTVLANGTAKLASLGYEIIFRDSGDVKRAYRAKNPSVNHPFIRVDETISDGTNSYTSTYAKYAMVGLIENMAHIDDYEDKSKLQLPLNTGNYKLNWRISGTGVGVLRGWSKWYFAARPIGSGGDDTVSPANGNRPFTLCGDKNAFYLLNSYDLTSRDKKINGCGLFNDNSIETSELIPNWFLMSHLDSSSANSSSQPYSIVGGSTLTYQKEQACFFIPRYNLTNRLSNNVKAYPIVPDYKTGHSDLNLTPIYEACFSIPIHDELARLRGDLKHINYVASSSMFAITTSTPRLSNNSMFVNESCYNPNGLYTGVSFYLGELE